MKKKVKEVRQQKKRESIKGKINSLSDQSYLKVKRNPTDHSAERTEKRRISYQPYFIVFVSLLLLVSVFSFASLAADKTYTLTLNVFIKKDITVTIQPAVKTAMPGSKVTYSAVIENKNPIPLELELTPVVPPGWTAEIEDKISLNAKATRSVNLKVTSDPSAAFDSYTIELRAKAAGESTTIEGKGKAAYIVDVHSAADITITPQTQTGLSGSMLQYNVRVKNNDPTGFDKSTLTVSPLLPKDWKGQLKKGTESKQSISVQLAPQEEADITYEVTSPSSAKKAESIGVNVTSNTVSTEGYAVYEITSCGDGICNIAEDSSTCPRDCGSEVRFACRNAGRCDEQADDGVRFAADADFQMSTFLVCKYGSTLKQCEDSKNSCGFGKPCLCSSYTGILASNAECKLRCVDNESTYYIYAKGIDDSARSIYNYSFSCPDVNLNEIKELHDHFSSSLESYEKAESALTETVNINPTKRFTTQPCIDAYSLAISRLSEYLKFIDGVIASPAVSNTTEARTRTDALVGEIEGALKDNCETSATGLLDITAIAQPAMTEIRSNAQGSVSVRNPGAVIYYGYTTCDFTLGENKITVNSTCTRLDPGASMTFKPAAAVGAAGAWQMQCRLYGSVAQDCAAANLHDTSEQLQFDVFSKDIYIVDVAGSCMTSGINCTVRTSSGKSCVQCRAGNLECTKTGQDGDKIFFNCAHVLGRFNLTAGVYTSQECNPVNPAEKSVESRCPICGDDIVDKDQGEECELPNTENNPYVIQESGLLCRGKLSAVRDEYGFCTQQCKAVTDTPSYVCMAGVCGAGCSDGGTRTVTVQKARGVCSYTQQCGSDCNFIAGDCEAPGLSVLHAPQLPTPSDVVDITATTSIPGIYNIEIFVDNSSRKICNEAQCTFSSLYKLGEHTYRAVLTSTNGTSADPAAGTKTFTVASAAPMALFNASHLPQAPVFGQNTTISAETNARDIVKIDIYADGMLKQRCTESPCVSADKYSLGTHTYYARLVTYSGADIRSPEAGTNSFTVSPATEEPASVRVFHDPANPTTGTAVTISAESDSPFTSMHIFVDNSSVLTCSSSPCNYTSTYAAGIHTYNAVMATASGNVLDPKTGVKTFNVTVVQVQPKISDIRFTLNHLPENPSVTQPVVISAEANASDITKIEIFVDDQMKKRCRSSPCSFTGRYQAGDHEYYATLTADGTTRRLPASGFNTFTVDVFMPTITLGDILFVATHTPYSSSEGKPVTINTETNSTDVDRIDIFVDDQLKQSCSHAPCSYTSTYSQGIHNYYAVLTSGTTATRTPPAGTNSFSITAPTCSITITNVTCSYDAAKRRYIVNAAASWNSLTTHHAHLDIENYSSQQLFTRTISFSSEQAGSGLKNVKAVVHDTNDSAVCQDQKQILCEGSGVTTGSGISVTRSVPDTVSLGITQMKLIVISDKDIQNFQLAENVPRNLNVSSFRVFGNSSRFVISGPTTVKEDSTDFDEYTIQGSLKGNENISVVYNIDFRSQGSYEFLSKTANEGREYRETRTVFATACPRPDPVFAVKDDECKQYTTACDVPTGWDPVSNCPSTYKPPEQPANLISIIAVLAIVIILVAAYFYRDKIRARLFTSREKKILKRLQGFQ
jgi:hypothetical protein